MDLTLLRQYFSKLANTQTSLQQARDELNRPNTPAFCFYKLVATRSEPAIDRKMLMHFLQSFTYHFSSLDTHRDSGAKLYPPESTDIAKLMERGVDLFLAKWSKTGQMNFQEFSGFLSEGSQLPSHGQQIDFSLKKKFFTLIEQQIQGLLDSETLRLYVAQECRNMEDLFETVSKSGQITEQHLHNLFLMDGTRLSEDSLAQIVKRFPIPCDFGAFRKWFSSSPPASKYKMQTKIYYSSLKRKKTDPWQSDARMTTPRGKKTGGVVDTTTQVTKGQRLISLKRSQVNVSQFSIGEVEESGEGVLVGVLKEEERVNQLKRKLIYQEDYDLQLLYERRGADFQHLLNNRYGTCNFTSFVRYLVPGDFEHRYLAFIKYQKLNKLSEETLDMVDHLLDEQRRKQEQIEQWWSGVDREVVFRGYCSPGDKGIPTQSLRKYFSERECKILLDRVDPSKTGIISYENFY